MNNIVYADTVGVDGTVYPTTGENIRNSSMLMNAKQIIKMKIVIKQNETLKIEPPITNNYQAFISVPNKHIFLIRLLNINITSDDTDDFLKPVIIDNYLAIKIRTSLNFNINGEIELLVGLV